MIFSFNIIQKYVVPIKCNIFKIHINRNIKTITYI